MTVQIDVAAVLRSHSEALNDAIAERIEAGVSSASTAELLTLTKPDGSRHRPSGWPAYVRLLLEYLRQGDKDNGELGIVSGAESIALDAVSAAITEFVSDPEVYSEANAALANGLAAHEGIRTEIAAAIASLSKQISREVQGAASEGGAQLLADGLASMGTQFAADIGKVAGTSVVAAALTKALALPAVKVAIVKGISAAMANAAFQKALLILLKKFGMVAVLKVLLLKAGVVAPLHAIGWALLAPVLYFILRHEAQVFPEKLAKRMSTRLAEELSGPQSQVYSRISEGMVDGAIGALKQAILDSGERVRSDRELQGAIQQADFEAFIGRILDER